MEVVEIKLSTELIPIKIAKVTSNNDWPLIYLPADAKRLLGLEKGVRVLIYVDPEGESLVIKKVKTTGKVGELAPPAERVEAHVKPSTSRG